MGKKYEHKGKVLEVHKSFAGWWIVGTRKPSGGFRRFKSPVLPPCFDARQAQRNLDAYARRLKLRVVKETAKE